MTLDKRDADFVETVWSYYRAHGRHDLPWRKPESDGSFDPYKILVSELMLQQTQVPRVMPKFAEFLGTFPSFQALAAAPLANVLKAWSGLGYNRRAKFLWQTAQVVALEYSGMLPDTSAELVKLPGIGYNTAGAILAYAFNKPAVFIETNVRTVVIHHFFVDSEQVSDAQIADAVARTLPDNPREWYWALMDYGTQLKQTIGNLNKLSKSYAKQSAFHGSKRQIRGQVLRLLAEKAHTAGSLKETISDERLEAVLQDLLHEGLIQKSTSYYKLAGA